MNKKPRRTGPKTRPSRTRPRPRPSIEDRPRPARPQDFKPEANEPSGPTPYAAHVAPAGVLAEAAATIALDVEHIVIQEHKRADRAIALALRRRRDLAAPDHRFISRAAFALFRWRGWIEPLRLSKPEARLLLAVLLDSTTVHPVCRVWAKTLGRDPGGLIALGDAPNWTARAEGLKRLMAGHAVTADPWRLFPQWLRESLPIPPGDQPPKARFLALLWALQSRPPLWVRAQGKDENVTWSALRDLGVNPWVHRRMIRAARLDEDVDVYHLEAFKKGELEIQDIAAQAVGLACDPDPGERWWDACAGAGGKALHLAALMVGKGVVVATDVNERKLLEAVRRARRSPWRNLTTKPWDGRHVAGKPGSFDGVLVDAPCSAVGTWRRNPDARWNLDRDAIPRLAALQADLLRAASFGVRPGGALVYSVCTLTPAETTDVVRTFLASHPTFRLDPFPHPFTGAPTDGTLTIWPTEIDSDAMFVARMVRSS
ncbi:MAG TPA: RsmB/NOP family class I SAM-dependent RNA methyltransferase [Isosphaeraceae bacterium]|jgi:16S rRNA (cytosine967-C5)-methyltransferase|nr:RsmB/NOP family class I SAM-dependent RNA methyltransferase [Isosphaeraceae bacterium]